MAHHTYKTRGFVLDSRGVGEAHMLITLVTEELGLISTVARSGRTLRSRLRYHVQPMSFGAYSLVRGKEAWRLVGARSDFNAFYELRNNAEATEFLGRYSALLRRLLAGEEASPELFTLITNVLEYVTSEKPMGETVENLEYVAVLRTLLLLGYVGEHRALVDVLALSPITTELLSTVSPLRRTMASEINRALTESHL